MFGYTYISLFMMFYWVYMATSSKNLFASIPLQPLGINYALQCMLLNKH